MNGVNNNLRARVATLLVAKVLGAPASTCTLNGAGGNNHCRIDHGAAGHWHARACKRPGAVHGSRGFASQTQGGH